MLSCTFNMFWTTVTSQTSSEKRRTNRHTVKPTVMFGSRAGFAKGSHALPCFRKFTANFSHLSHLRTEETRLDEREPASGLWCCLGFLFGWFLLVLGLLVFFSPSSCCVSFPFNDDLGTPPTRRPYSGKKNPPQSEHRFRLGHAVMQLAWPRRHGEER